MLGNMGIGEWVIVAAVVAVPAALIAGVVILAASMRRRTGSDMTAPNQVQMHQILEALQKMDQRISNLEAILMQRGNVSEAERNR